MKYSRLAAWLLSFLIVVAPASASTRIEKVTSPGGVTAWLVQDRSVPIISLSLSFAGGAALDPAGKGGLADMVSGLLDEGAGDLDSQAYQKALKDISASISFDAGRDYFHGSLRTLSRNRSKAFRLLRLALGAPRFETEPVERIRSQLIAGLKSEKDNPRRIAGRTWFRLVFPKHPYGNPVAGTMKSVKAIEPKDLRGFVKRRFARDRLIIGVVGDITPRELARRLDDVFGRLPAKSDPIRIKEARPRGAGKVVVVRKPIPQSIVIFGQRGVKRDDPDYYAAYVMNYILGGGGFSSRLTEEVREKRGLAYSVYSYLNPMNHAGLIMGGMGTQNARVADSLSIVRAEWQRIAQRGVERNELKAAKTYINGSFPLRLDSGRRIAGMLVAIQVNKLGIDYLDRRAKFIDAVTGADVKRVAGRLLKERKLTVVVVGDPKGMKNIH